MHLSGPISKRGVDPTAEMITRTVIVGECETLCGSCGAEVPLNVNICVNRNCGMQWLFVAADHMLDDDTMIDLWYRLCGERPGLMFIGVVGFEDDGGYYLAEACFLQGRSTLRQTLRRLYLELRRKDETR